jgi:DNA-binding beta-propeller fold protein YncE
VETDPINLTTTFALDVVVAASAGQRTVVGTLYTTVEVMTPWIAPASHVALSPSHRFAMLRWIAYNSRGCEIAVDGIVVDEHAPTNTYRAGAGYPLYLSGNVLKHDVALTAHAWSGEAEAPFLFPPVVARVPVSVAVGDTPEAVAISPDGKVALVGNYNGMDVSVVDLKTLRADPHRLPVGGRPVHFAFMPDSTRALVSSTDGGGVRSIDIASRVVSPTKLVDLHTSGLAITPDGLLALLADSSHNVVRVLNLVTGSVEPTSIPVGRGPESIAVTPDGRLALVGNEWDGTLSVVDIRARRVVGQPISVGHMRIRTAVSADGRRAAVTSATGNAVIVIDVGSLQVLRKLTTGPLRLAVAITPNGSHALLVARDRPSVEMFDLATGASERLGDVGAAAGAAIAPDGSLAVISDIGGKVVVY